MGNAEVTCNYPFQCSSTTVTDDVASDVSGVGCFGYKSCFSSDIRGTFIECAGSHSCFAAESIIQATTSFLSPFLGIRCDSAASCMNAETIEFDYGVSCIGPVSCMNSVIMAHNGTTQNGLIECFGDQSCRGTVFNNAGGLDFQGYGAYSLYQSFINATFGVIGEVGGEFGGEEFDPETIIELAGYYAGKL